MRGGHQGDRPNIAHIAALANVSTSAVSYALNGRAGVGEATRARILEIAARLNWQPSSAARSLKSERAFAVGMVTIYDPARPVLSAGFASAFLVGVQHELRQHGVLLTLDMVDDVAAASEVYRRWEGERRVDGVFVLNPVTKDPRLDTLSALTLPTVVVGDVRRRHPALGSAWSDDVAATSLAVDHLAALGHMRIGLVGGEPRLRHVAIRRRAFFRALERRGLEADDRVNSRSTVDQIAALITDRVPLTAVLVDDTEAAISIVVGLQQRGMRVPEDLSVVLWDDDERTTLVHPPLTVLRRGVVDYGREAARALITSIQTSEPVHVLAAKADLVVRGSTTAPAR